MATKIKDTPVLSGEDAIRFLKAIEKPEKVSESERQRIRNGYNAIQAISKINNF
jgi:hypothetical protein